MRGRRRKAAGLHEGQGDVVVLLALGFLDGAEMEVESALGPHGTLEARGHGRHLGQHVGHGHARHRIHESLHALTQGRRLGLRQGHAGKQPPDIGLLQQAPRIGLQGQRQLQKAAEGLEVALSALQARLVAQEAPDDLRVVQHLACHALGQRVAAGWIGHVTACHAALAVEQRTFHEGRQDLAAQHAGLGLPGQRLHAAQAAAQHRRQLPDAQGIEHARLGVDPVFHRHDGEVGAVGLAGVRVGVHRARRAKAGAGVVDADDEELVGVHRFARANHVVPPALAFGQRLPIGARVQAGDVVRGVERMAHQHGVAGVGVELAVGFAGEGVVAQLRTALQVQRFAEVQRGRRDDAK